MKIIRVITTTTIQQIITHLVLLLLAKSSHAFLSQDEKAPVLDDTKVTVAAKGGLHIWQVEGATAHPFMAFMSKELLINLTANDYEFYQGVNASQVREEHGHDQRLFGLWRRANVWKQKRLPAFDDTFIGVDSAQPYDIRIRVRNFDVLRAALFAAAIWLFYMSRRVARHSVFYYSAGTSIGVLASLILLVMLVHKLIPKSQSSLAYSVLLGGWSFSLYVLYSVWHNLHTILVTYHKWVAVYLTSVTLISLAVCYRIGPPNNVRSLNICQWTLQALSMLVLYSSCQIESISFAVMAVLLVTYNVPVEWLRRVRGLWHRICPPKRRFLSEQEYIQQGAIETELALKQLREFCASPDCNAWKTVSRLQSPMRFASFVDGGSHLSDAELLQFDEYSFNVVDDDEEDDAAQSVISDDSDDDASDGGLDEQEVRLQRQLNKSRTLGRRGLLPVVTSPSTSSTASSSSLRRTGSASKSSSRSQIPRRTAGSRFIERAAVNNVVRRSTPQRHDRHDDEDDDSS